VAAVTAVLIGAGQRGYHVYGRWAEEHPDELRFVAVLDTDPARVDRFTAAHPGAEALATVSDLDRVDAEVCVVATPDRGHFAAALAALDAGKDVYLEKPVASRIEEVVALAGHAAASGRLVHVAHVLRSTPFYRAVRETVRSGRLGDIVDISMRENVAAWHMAHSYVRGAWSKVADSSPMIVTKCCHDFDILHWVFADPVVSLWSHGTLLEFQPERAPAGATERCTDPCPVTDCPYDARSVYLDADNTGWPVHVITDDFSREGRLRALSDGPYGRCVYRAGSDVVDHQVVAMALSSGASASLTMHGHSGREERTLRIDGTRASVHGRFGRVQELEIVDHRTGSTRPIEIATPRGGHGGGDEGSIRSFLAAATGEAGETSPLEDALESHFVAFAAETSRVSGSPIDMAAFRAGAGL
jgi:predicted dehydrogenase